MKILMKFNFSTKNLIDIRLLADRASFKFIEQQKILVRKHFQVQNILK